MDAIGIPHSEAGLLMRVSEDFGVFGWDAKATMLCLRPGKGYATLYNPDFVSPTTRSLSACRYLTELRAIYWGRRRSNTTKLDTNKAPITTMPPMMTHLPGCSPTITQIRNGANTLSSKTSSATSAALI